MDGSWPYFDTWKIADHMDLVFAKVKAIKKHIGAENEEWENF